MWRVKVRNFLKYTPPPRKPWSFFSWLFISFVMFCLSLVLYCHTLSSHLTGFFKSISYKTRFVPNLIPKLKRTKYHKLSGNPDALCLHVVVKGNYIHTYYIHLA